MLHFPVFVLITTISVVLCLENLALVRYASVLVKLLSLFKFKYVIFKQALMHQNLKYGHYRLIFVFFLFDDNISVIFKLVLI